MESMSSRFNNLIYLRRFEVNTMSTVGSLKVTYLYSTHAYFYIFRIIRIIMLRLTLSFLLLNINTFTASIEFEIEVYFVNWFLFHNATMATRGTDVTIYNKTVPPACSNMVLHFLSALLAASGQKISQEGHTNGTTIRTKSIINASRLSLWLNFNLKHDNLIQK